MFDIRRSQDRGVSDQAWLHSRHSFSFADYVDPQCMGFSVLRVINDDEVAPGAGFPTHAHRDMEIISIVLQGSIAHKDSMGHVTQLQAGEVQRMSAGTGITHSEYNPSPDEALHFLQIWIKPDRRGIAPSYEQRSLLAANPELHSEEKKDNLNLLVSPEGQEGALAMQQDARLYLGRFSEGETMNRTLDSQRRYYLHMIRGELRVQQYTLSAGDALAMDDETVLRVESDTESEFLWFDLP